MNGAVFTTQLYLLQLVEQIESGPFTLSQVAAAAGLPASAISRWRNPLSTIEPRLSAVERLAEAHERMLGEWRMANPEAAAELGLTG